MPRQKEELQTPDGLVGILSQPWTASLQRVSPLWLNHHGQVSITCSWRQSKRIQPLLGVTWISEWTEISKQLKIRNLKYLLLICLHIPTEMVKKKNSREWTVGSQSSLRELFSTLLRTGVIYGVTNRVSVGRQHHAPRCLRTRQSHLFSKLGSRPASPSTGLNDASVKPEASALASWSKSKGGNCILPTCEMS